MAKAQSFDFNLLRALEVFSTVVEQGQVTRAAGLLGITQSAASQHLANLERHFACTLLDRSVRPIQLTKAGIALHQRAQSLLAEAEELQSGLRRIDGSPIPVLRVAMLASIATTLTPVVLQITRQLYSIPAVSTFAGLAADHQEGLSSKQTDLAITSDAFYDLDGLERLSVLRERFLLVLPRDCQADTDDLSQLAKTLPLVRFSPDTGVGRRVDQHLRRVRLDLPRVVDADRASMVVAAVAAGQGFTILTPSLLIDALREGWPIETKPLPLADFSREIHLVYRAGELEDLPQRLLGAVRDSLSQAIHRLLPDLPEGTLTLSEEDA